MDNRDELLKRLGSAINQTSAENGSNTPDFVLAEYLAACLDVFDDAVQKRAAWYGRMDEPGGPPIVSLETSLVYSEIQRERERQDQKWGRQDHPDGTGPDMRWMVDRGDHTWHEATPTAEQIAGLMRRLCQEAAARGEVTWQEIDLEEVAESYAEDDPAKLRVELIQRAAVLVAWIEAIDRRNRA